MKEKYFNIAMLIERLHRLFLDVIKVELDRDGIADISNVQCMILYNVGKNKMTIGEISNRGYYLGSNVTYNLKKMVENGYLVQSQSVHDKRSSTIKLSKKGEDLYHRMDAMLERHLKNLSRNGLADTDIEGLFKSLENLENFWSFMLTRDLR